MDKSTDRIRGVTMEIKILIELKAPGCEWLFLTEEVKPYFARPA
jgi:hypothetical protein